MRLVEESVDTLALIGTATRDKLVLKSCIGHIDFPLDV